MDEMWQRHKSFILQVLVGGVLFLVAFFVMRSMYGDQNDPEKIRAKNELRKKELQAKLDEGHAPSAASIREQREIADNADKEKQALAKRVASVAGSDAKMSDADRERAYVSENIARVLENIGKQDDGYLALYQQVPQACLSRLRDAARAVLVGKAAQAGKEIDEALGLGQAFADEDIPEALHGLAIVTDVYVRCLAEDHVDKIASVRISPRSSFPEQNEVSLVSAIGVHLELHGDPGDVNEVLRSFNAVDNKAVRMTVLESIDFIVPLSADEDTVKASFNVAGLRYQSRKQAEGN
jgi:hypothetical protein